MKETDLIELAQEQFALGLEAESVQRERFKEDLDIFDGDGIWPEQLRRARQNNPRGARPCLNVSDLPARVHQITNDVRQNPPSIKTRPVDDNADVETAEIFDGIIRHIEEQSQSDIAFQTANFHQVVGGYGYFRITDGWSRQEGQRELFIRPIYDVNSVVFDPWSMCPVGSDAQFAFVSEEVARKQFEREYPDVDLTGSEAFDSSDGNAWVSDESVRVSEWFRLEQKKGANVIKAGGQEYSEEEYWSLEDRPTVEDAGQPEKTVCVWRKIVGTKILREVELPISYIPIIRVPGEMYVKEGRIVFKGLVRDSRDAVRAVSFQMSALVEAIALEPKAPYIGVKGAFDGEEDVWAMANTENLPFLEYNPVDVNGSPAPAPARQPPPMASQGIAQALMLSKDALKSVTGQHDASMGAQGNETSGKAILARQREGDVANYHFIDNLSKAVRFAGRILIAWIPYVYDERRVARIVGEDGEPGYADLDNQQPEAVRKVQGPDGIKRIYNLGVGCYDVISTVGPSYTTKRQEAVAAMTEVMQGNPNVFPLIGDLWMRAQDWPGADDMAKRLKAMVPPQALQADEEDGQQIPPEVQAMVQQLQAQLQEGAQIVQELQAENEQLQQQMQAKQQEKAAEIEGRITQEKIKQAGEIERAEIDAESKERVAMLEAQQAETQHKLDTLMQYVIQLMQMEQAEANRELGEGEEAPQ